MQKKRSQTMATMRGFTIIEVVLVLAIAGLIFLMVFIALPAMQRSQKDTQRRDDMSRFMAAIQSYQANNSNMIPALGVTGVSGTGSMTEADFLKKYLKSDKGEFKDPDGTDYDVSPSKYTTSSNFSSNTFDGKTIYYVIGAKCDPGNEGSPAEASGNRNFAIYYVLEGGGIYCGDNS